MYFLNICHSSSGSADVPEPLSTQPGQIRLKLDQNNDIHVCKYWNWFCLDWSGVVLDWIKIMSVNSKPPHDSNLQILKQVLSGLNWDWIQVCKYDNWFYLDWTDQTGSLWVYLELIWTWLRSNQFCPVFVITGFNCFSWNCRNQNKCQILSNQL